MKGKKKIKMNQRKIKMKRKKKKERKKKRMNTMKGRMKKEKRRKITKGKNVFPLVGLSHTNSYKSDKMMTNK